MGDAAVLPAEKSDELADAGTAKPKEEVTGGGQAKGTQIEDSPSESDSTPHIDDSPSESDSTPRAASDASKAGDLSVPGVLKMCTDAVRAALALLAAVLTFARAALLLSTLVALWLSAGQPCRAVWTLMVIAITYLALWTIYLTAAIHPLTVLVSLSYVMLLAISVTHLSSAAGVFLMLLDTAYAAGLFGYALAEYRQRKGLERSAQALQTRAKQEGLGNNKAAIIMVSVYATVPSILFTVGAALVIWYISDMYWLVLLLSLLIDLSLFWWACFVALHLLHEVLFEHYYMSFIYLGIALLLLPDFFLSYLFGQAIGVLVHPIGLMGMAGLLGYSLSVYVRYKHIRTQ